MPSLKLKAYIIVTVLGLSSSILPENGRERNFLADLKYNENFTCVCTIFLNSSSLWDFLCYFRQLKNAKSTETNLQLFWYKAFVY